MNINKNTKFWVVTNPTKDSTLEDILFECDLKGSQQVNKKYSIVVKPMQIYAIFPTKFGITQKSCR